MNQFYLNNLIGAPRSKKEGVDALRLAAMAFGELVADKKLNVSEQIVMDKDPAIMQFGDFFLSELVHSVTDNDEKQQLYIMLRGAYPMDDHIAWDEGAEPLIEADYKCEGKDATNLAVAKRNGAMSISVAYEDCFKKNELRLTATGKAEGIEQEISIENLYGSDENKQYIKKLLEGRESVEIDLFEKVKGLGVVHGSVEKLFKKKTDAIQKSIIDGFNEAIRQNLITPHAGDGNNVIEPNDSLVRYERYTNKEKLFELAIDYPLTLRVIMAQFEGELFILDIKTKKEMSDGGEKQNKVLRDAEKRFIQMKESFKH